MVDGALKIPAVNTTKFRIIAVSSLHLKGSVSDINFLHDEKKKFEIEKENGLSVFWDWKYGETFPYAMVKLSGAKITSSLIRDYGIKKIYFFLVKEVEK